MPVEKLKSVTINFGDDMDKSLRLTFWGHYVY